MPHSDPKVRKQYHSQYHRKWYRENRKKRLNQIREREKEVGEWFQKHKKLQSCSLCGENTTVCLDYHHIDSSKKEAELSQAHRRGWSIERIKKEIKKCIIVCANCHRKIHTGIIASLV